MTDAVQPPNIFFRLVVITSVIFVVTIFALTATVFSDPRAPVVQFLNEYGGVMITCEVAATLFSGVLALAIDRRRSLAAQTIVEFSNTDESAEPLEDSSS